MKRRTLLKAAAVSIASPFVARAVTERVPDSEWRVERFALDPQGARSMPASPNKHSRVCYASLTRRHYFLGGDMRNPWAIESGVNTLWSYDALAQREGREAWRLEYPYWGPAGEVQPCHPDEVTLVEDAKRGRLLMAGGYMFKETLYETPWKAGAATPVRQRLMSFDHTGNRKWQVREGDFFGGQSGSRGVLDPIDDRVYYAYYDGGAGTAIRVLDLSSHSIERRFSNGDARSKPAARWRQGAIDPERRLMWFLDCGKREPARIFEVDLRSFKNRLLATLPWPVYSAIDMPYLSRSRELFLWGPHGGSPESVLVSTESGALHPGPPQPRNPQGTASYLNYSSYDPTLDAIISFGTVGRPGAVDAIFHYSRNNKPLAQALFFIGSAHAKAVDANFLPAPGEVKGVARNNIRAVGACPSKDCVYLAYGGLAGMLKAWTSGIIAESWGPYGALVVHGGGDGDYFGTEAYAFPFDTLKWERVGEPTTAMNGKGHKKDPSFDRIECEHGDGTPGTPHTHDTLHWLPPSYMGNKRGGLLRVCSTIVYTVCDTYRSHVLDLDTGKWSRFSLNKAKSHGLGKVQGSVFDPKRDRIWRSPSPPRPTGLSYLDLRSRQHTDLKIKAPKETAYMGTSVYLEKSDTWAMLGVNRPSGEAILSLLDLKDPRAWQTGRLGGDEIPKSAAYGCGFEFCPDLQCIFAYMPSARRGRQQVLWRIEVPEDPFQGEWQVKQLTMRGEKLPDFQATGTFKRWHWVPALKCFCYVGSVDGQTYLYRPEGI
ncbi:MAG TPA: hypothetical protein VJU83_03000 [Burkholderiales bacterium]|nr:hypothetical protein [Burkholderiales bacterium]